MFSSLFVVSLPHLFFIIVVRTVGEAASRPVDEFTNMFNENLQKSPISKCEFPGLDYVLFVKGSEPHLIDYGYVDGKPTKEVVVSRKCAEAVLRGAQVSFLSISLSKLLSKVRISKEIFD